jgi:HSP20 family molecular chaperone IbpA
VAKQESDKSRYWITERSVGSFHRTFQLPTRVDHDGVKANLKNGILNILIPKAKAKEPRKVNIE